MIRQRVVDLVSDPSSHLAQRGEFGHGKKLLLLLFTSVLIQLRLYKAPNGAAISSIISMSNSSKSRARRVVEEKLMVP